MTPEETTAEALLRLAEAFRRAACQLRLAAFRFGEAMREWGDSLDD